MTRLKKIFIGLVAVDLIGTAAFFGFTRSMDDSADLSGGTGIIFFSDNGNEANARIERGLQLLDTEKLDRLIMVGGHRPQDGFIGSQEMALAAIRRSGRAGQISADVSSRDTVSGLRNLAADPSTLRGGVPVLISSCMHLLRARTIFKSTAQDGRAPRSACTESSKNPISIWVRAHYELGAWTLYALPDSWRDAVIDALRGKDTGYPVTPN